MTTITISDLATSPQINSRRVAHDLIEWLAHRGWVIVQGAPELPFGRDPYPPAPLPPAAAEPIYRSSALQSLHETMADLHTLGAVDNATMRDFDARCLCLPLQVSVARAI